VEIRGGTNWALDSCTLSNSEYAAGIYCFGGSGVMEGCTVSRNGGDGVGVAEGASVLLRDCSISENAGNGIQVYHATSQISIKTCRIEDNGQPIGFGEDATEQQVITA